MNNPMELKDKDPFATTPKAVCNGKDEHDWKYHVSPGQRLCTVCGRREMLNGNAWVKVVNEG